MQKIIDTKRCTGCHACFDACPKGCISMESDKEGFLRPVIDEKTCISCGKCQSVCPVIKEKAEKPAPKAYAVKSLIEDVRAESSSGGVFSLLAEAVLEKGGVVFGAAFDENFSVHHIYIENQEDLYKLRGSKYVQSRIGNAYKEAKQFLEAGRQVLFSGTPCQIAGLRAFLGREYENLILQDIICHGVPSPKVWEMYKAYREEKTGSKIKKVSFREKESGWKTSSVSIQFANGETYIENLQKDIYMKAFLRNLDLRKSCYACHEKTVGRQSDITLADFWGIEKVMPEMDDDRGTSLVLIHSEKGETLFSALRDKMNMHEVEINEAIRHNSAAYKSVEKPIKRAAFLKNVTAENFTETVEKHLKKGYAVRFLEKIKRTVLK